MRDKISDVGRPMPITPRAAAGAPGPMAVVGGGAAVMRRRNAAPEGYGGSVTIVSADDAPPYDRPNLSKDYLAGTAPEEWIPLRPAEFYAESGIQLRLRTTATAIDLSAHRILLAGGESLPFDKLLLATGAEPIRLQVPGIKLEYVRMLRSLADSRELIARARKGCRAVIVGASFIGSKSPRLCAIAKSRLISSPPEKSADGARARARAW